MGGVNKIRNVWDRKIICGGREEEEEAGTVKHCVERDIYWTRSVDLLARQKETKCYEEKCGCENGNSNALTLRGDQHWHESCRWFSNKIERSQTSGQLWADPCLFVPRLE